MTLIQLANSIEFIRSKDIKTDQKWVNKVRYDHSEAENDLEEAKAQGESYETRCCDSVNKL